MSTLKISVVTAQFFWHEKSDGDSRDAEFWKSTSSLPNYGKFI